MSTRMSILDPTYKGVDPSIGTRYGAKGMKATCSARSGLSESTWLRCPSLLQQVAGICLICRNYIIFARLPAYFVIYLNLPFNSLSPAGHSG
jgi:hypothetical protein